MEGRECLEHEPRLRDCAPALTGLRLLFEVHIALVSPRVRFLETLAG